MPTSGRRRASAAPERSDERPLSSPGLIAVGIVAATAPLWMLAIGLFSGGGPRTTVLSFAVPVLLSTALAVWATLNLGSRRSRWAVGITAIVVGVVSYPIWFYLASLGIRFGDGPL